MHLTVGTKKHFSRKHFQICHHCAFCITLHPLHSFHWFEFCWFTLELLIAMSSNQFSYSNTCNCFSLYTWNFQKIKLFLFLYIKVNAYTIFERICTRQSEGSVLSLHPKELKNRFLTVLHLSQGLVEGLLGPRRPLVIVPQPIRLPSLTSFSLKLVRCFDGEQIVISVRLEVEMNECFLPRARPFLLILLVQTVPLRPLAASISPSIVWRSSVTSHLEREARLGRTSVWKSFRCCLRLLILPLLCWLGK